MSSGFCCCLCHCTADEVLHRVSSSFAPPSTSSEALLLLLLLLPGSILLLLHTQLSLRR